MNLFVYYATYESDVSYAHNHFYVCIDDINVSCSCLVKFPGVCKCFNVRWRRFASLLLRSTHIVACVAFI